MTPATVNQEVPIPMPSPDDTKRHDGGVQSLHRALDLVEVVAARGGHLTIGEIAVATDLPLPRSM